MSIISNTTVISNFAAIDKVDLLRQLYGIIHIPTEVYTEIRVGIEEGYLFYHRLDGLIAPTNPTGWIQLVAMSEVAELAYFATHPPQLHQGEASCLAIAKMRGWLLLTDDKAARQEALLLGITLSGSIGCLVLAVEQGLCTLAQANAWLMAMIKEGYRSPLTDLTPLIKKSTR